MKKVLNISLGTLFLLSSCVSSKKYQKLLTEKDNIKTTRDQNQEQIDSFKSKLLICDNNYALSKNQVKSLEQEIEYFKSTNTNLLDRLADLSIVSKSGAQSIKKSLEALNEQNKYIKDLTSSMRQKDSLNLLLVLHLKRSLSDINDEDINIEVKKGVVYISLSDKMLFKTGSAQIQPKAEEVLGKIAKVVNDFQSLDILVEGHTDSVPISRDCLIDNWDLSVKRSTSVVRTLQTKYGVKPERMTAGGRGEYVPKASNNTEEGKSINRRTEIIILPKLDEFFNLLQSSN
jgi:chemotaxis protein MotB